MTQSLRDRLLALEQALMTAATRASAADLDALLAEDFLEIGSSGRRYDKPAVIAALLASPRRTDPPPVLEEIALCALGPATMLLTYRIGSSDPAAGGTWRSSIWVEQSGAWRLRFHQGTPIGR